MAYVYKVWIDIEEYDEDTGDGALLDCINIGCSGTFATREEAEAFAKELNEHRDESGFE